MMLAKSSGGNEAVESTTSSLFALILDCTWNLFSAKSIVGMSKWFTVSPTLLLFLLVMLVLYLLMEIGFYIYFKQYLIVRANECIMENKCKALAPYHDYGRDRCRLLKRIFHRLERQAQQRGCTLEQAVKDLLLPYFRPVTKQSKLYQQKQGEKESIELKEPLPLERTTSLTSACTSSSLSSSQSSTIPYHCSESSDEDEQQQNPSKQKTTTTTCKPKQSTTTWSIPGIKKSDANDFFAWAFFAKQELEPYEREELKRIFDFFQEKCGLVFPDSSEQDDNEACMLGRRLNLEPVQKPIHRPLLLYIILNLIQCMGNLYLRFILGYRRYTTSAGLVYWFRDATPTADQQSTTKQSPLLFFHGIAPAGKTFYIPFLHNSVPHARRRPMFLFENSSISSTSLSFNALTDEETCRGVHQALDRHLDQFEHIVLMGHSFGSCPLTWLLRHADQDETFSYTISQVILIDPVTILLSEPDVMVNFVYARHELQEGQDQSRIQVMAGSELFTEYYLRRYFAWYNCELWLCQYASQQQQQEQKPQFLICVSEQDEIINAPRVKAEILANQENASNIELIFWPDVNHANCITCPENWKEIHQSIQQMEEGVRPAMANTLTRLKSE